MRMAVLALALSFGAVLACTKHIDKPPHEGDRASGPGGGGAGSSPGVVTGDGGLVGTGADGGLCTDLDVVGLPIEGNGVNGDFSGSGGPIGDGTYDLVEVRTYEGPSGIGGPTGVTYQGAVRINGTAYESVIVQGATLVPDAGSSATEVRSSGTLTPSGTDQTATLVLACPGAGTQNLSYSALSGSLTLYNVSSRVALVLRARQ